MAEVGKKLKLRLPRKAVQAAQGPYAVHGVVHRGTPGVGIFHEGKMTAWGPNESAAWETHKVSAVGKRGDWSVPFDHFDAPTPRLRPNYRTGTAAVGKRMPSGAVTGVAKPKRVQPTRVAARKTPGAGIPMRDDTAPPIPAHLIGKAIPKWKAHALSVESHDKIGRALDRGARGQRTSWPKTTHYVTRLNPGVDDREVVETYRRRRGKVRSYGITDVGKRSRTYDPELNRQRRLGAATAILGVGGGTALGSAGHEIRNASHLADVSGPSLRVKAAQPGTKREAKSLLEHLAERKKHGTVVVTRRARNKAGIGLGLLSAAGGTASYARSRANRKWY